MLHHFHVQYDIKLLARVCQCFCRCVTIVDLKARLLGREIIPLATSVTPAVAVIDESACIGCYHCRNACPVDAIVGAHQFMHTVIASECTGCELCVAPCPVDCITMRPLS